MPDATTVHNDALADPKLSAEARRVVRAALRGSSEITAALTSTESDSETTDTSNDVATAEAGKIFLTRISLAGFRGIADALDIEFAPRPGLVLVTGRNGSGKSSIAEAAEFALSGASLRADSTRKDGLLNIHAEGGATIGVDVRVDGVGDLTISCTLASDDPQALATQVTKAGEAYELEAHGWRDAMARYRPVLTYEDLSSMATAKRSTIYDAINGMLGLDDMTDADKALTSAATEQRKISTHAEELCKALISKLGESEDPRAAQLIAALLGTPDVEAARAILIDADGGGTAAQPERAALSGWAGLQVPDTAAAEAAAITLSEAINSHGTTSAGAAGRALQLAQLLDLVIQHREGEDARCPVCGEGILDSNWLAEAHQKAEIAKSDAKAAQDALSALGRARVEARALVIAKPPVLDHASVDNVDPSEAAGAWQALEALGDVQLTETDRDSGLVAKLADTVAELSSATEQLVAAAKAALAARDTAWGPLAEQAAEVVRALDDSAIAKQRVTTLTEARAWLKAYTERLRVERLKLFDAEASAVWKELRQDSNVAFSGVELVGATTQRRVRLDLEVDGTNTESQAVLSQGELTALGIALFLPRSTFTESPFRFAIIDDPVQSMDPSKVDGLARLLHRVGQTHQLIVFTHDDRLLKALRHLGLATETRVVTRGDRSKVSIERVAEPVAQYFRDADALAKDTRLPADLIWTAVSGYCRDAINEAFADKARRVLLDEGTASELVDQRIQGAGGTWGLLALALLRDAKKTGAELDAALEDLRPGTRAAVKACVDGVHEPDSGQPKILVGKVRAIVAAIQDA